MKRKLSLMITAFMLMMTGLVWGQTRADVVTYTLDGTVTGGSNGYATESEITQDGMTWMVMGNTTMNPWRIGGKSLTNENRPIYSTGTISDDVTKIVLTHGTATNVTVNSITLIVSPNSDFSSPVSTMTGEFVESSTTTFTRPAATSWAGMYYKIVYNLTISVNSNKFLQFYSAEFYKEQSGSQETVATPTFSPAGGTYFDTQSVSIGCTTADATIRYTLDETEPTESSAIYSTPISVSATTTIKAKAFKSGYTASAVATATYTFPSLITIAEARALADNEYALVQGIVTFIEGRNVYVQDETGGIDLYLNANASGLNIGDKVKAYGKKTVYNGLVELTGINQNSSAFAVVSTGNTLPLAVKTIAEINAGGADALQCTRVKIESATIGTINTGGNTPLTQGENSVNIYKVPTLTGIEEGDEVDVIGVVGYFSNPQIRVANASDVTLSYIPDPQLAVTPTQLSGFNYTYGSGPSANQSFTLSGSDLEGNVTVTAPQDFQVTQNPNGAWYNTFNITPNGGTLSNTSVYVRMKSGLAVGDHSGNVSIACGTLSASVSVSGTVSEQPVAATPTFSPNGGDFITAQSVSMSCTTEGSVIHYTTDGSDPDENSDTYSNPITVSTTTTVKAIAVADGYQNSAIASATFTINLPITIAAARALENNEYACVEGTVTLMDGRNIYVQDDTAGIDLYLNSNTVPSTLALGDKVRAYGKKTTYNGLVELTSINGSNANVFTVISTGNALPLDTKTIAEINTDFSGSNLLQATRVKVENAIIGAINPSGTTVISQEGNTMNVYHIPTVEGMLQGDWVTITGVIGCYNAPQLLVASADDIQYTHRPTLTANPTSISGLTYAYDNGGPSQIVSFDLSGQYLLDNVRVYPSESFEVSTYGGNRFAPEDPATVFNQGHFNNIQIYVRMKADLDGGTYNEQLYVVSEYADTLFINVTGTVTGGQQPPEPPTPPTPGDGNYVRISDLSNLTEGSYVVFAARFDDNATNYYAMTAASSGKPTGVLFTSATADENEVLPASIVDEEDSYYWIVGVTANGYTFTNALGELIGYSSSTNFATGGDNTEWAIEINTAGDEAMVPGYTGFVISNVNNTVRCFALNSNHNFGPYHTNNLNSSSYNFYLDLFVKVEGGDPPTPTVATPTFTPAAGTYYEAQTVTISCSTADATIYYTLDGSDPTASSSVYSAPLTIEATTTVKAIAMKEGYNDSNIAEATYTIQLGFVTIFNQDWEGEMNGWTFVDVTGEASWSIASYQGNHYAYANGYNHGANEDWCISPAFNLDAYDNPTLSFRTAKNYTGNDLEVYFSNDYDGEDPTNATWQLLVCPLSSGGWTWVESGDINLGSFSGTECYIGFKYTCEEGSAAGWEVDDILLLGQTSNPVVTVTPLALTGFTYIEGNGPSDEQSFTVSGLNLSNNIIITDAPDFEISLLSGNNFAAQSTLTLSATGGNVEETTIYVRMKAGLAVGSYDDEVITITSEVDDIEVSCSGTVTEQPVPGDDYVRISAVSELAAGNRVILASRYNETANAYVAIQNTLSGGKLNTTEFTSAMNGADEIIPAEILLIEDEYYWTVGVTADGYTFTNANGDVIGYSSSTNFNMNGEKTEWTVTTGTSGEGTMVPNYFGFNIINVTTDNRAFALNANHVCGAYHTQNMNGADYNFFLDIFMQGEGGVPPTPTVAAPTFTPGAGTYYETQEVTINCTTEGATIYYSLDTQSGPWYEYEDPIDVDESMTIWAYASKEGYNDSPVVSAEYVILNDIVIIFNQDWEDGWHGWTEVNVEGDSLWRIASYQGNHYAYANGYNHEPTTDWLISPAFDLDSYSDVVLTFRTAQNYTGPELELFFSNDYDGQDPTTATWYGLEFEASQGGWNWVESGDISLDDFNGSNCYIAYKYTSNDAAAGWEVDDIMLASGGGSTNPTITATPNAISSLDYIIGEGPSASQSYALTAVNLNGEGDITVTASENFEISLDDEDFFETLEIPFANGVITNQPVTIYVRLVEGLEIGSYEDLISHAGGDAYTEVSVMGTVHSEDEPMMEALLPLYIQGNNGTNNNRVPMAAPVHFGNLMPNATYRYTNQFVDGNDGPETAGAGNVIYADPEGFYRSTSPSLATEGGYGEFTTDDEGHAIVWLMNEPTANARFTPGNHVFMRVRLNDGNEGTTVDQVFTSEDYATVLNFGTEIDEYSGSAFYVKSNEAPMSFAFMYTDFDELRPAYATSIETIGVDFGNINQYADFYKDLVVGNDGWFGGILPNDNETGITYILTSSMDFLTINEYVSEDGQWYPEANTINPTNGLDEPIFIDLTDDGVVEPVATNVNVWSTDNAFVIENSDNCHYTMNVVNVLGQTLMTREIAAGCTVRVSHNLTAGVYIVSLQNNQNKVAVKVIVK